MKSRVSCTRFFQYLLVILIALAGTAYGTVYTVTNTNDTGNGSFRWAILEANANAGADTVEFNIPGSGPHTIQPLSALPTLSESVVIDGYSQLDAVPATASNPAVLQIAVDGASLGGSGVGIKISALDCKISGLCIRDCMEYGIHIHYGGYALISGCYIGTDITGQNRAGGWDSSINIFNASNNTIGGTNPASRNLISGTNGDGIDITSGSTGNVIQGNCIGTDVSGSSILYNGGSGIALTLASGNTIGGTVPGAGNVISGNHSQGISLSNSLNHVVQGNYIGTDRTGMIDLGNTYDGILLNNVDNITIGGSPAAARNIISGNGDDGIGIVSGSSGSLVQGNYIGTDATGTAALGNDGYGMEIDGAPGNTIGGTAAGAGNILSSNGADVTGTVALGNTWEGVYIEEAPDNTIGGAGPGARNIISGNGFISGSGGGVVFWGGGATGNQVLGNYIGTDVTGSLDMGNRSDGVSILG